MPPDLALLSTLNGTNYPCLELIFMVLKVFEPLKFDCMICPPVREVIHSIKLVYRPTNRVITITV